MKRLSEFGKSSLKLTITTWVPGLFFFYWEVCIQIPKLLKKCSPKAWLVSLSLKEWRCHQLQIELLAFSYQATGFACIKIISAYKHWISSCCPNWILSTKPLIQDQALIPQIAFRKLSTCLLKAEVKDTGSWREIYFKIWALLLFIWPNKCCYLIALILTASFTIKASKFSTTYETKSSSKRFSSHYKQFRNHCNFHGNKTPTIPTLPS